MDLTPAEMTATGVRPSSVRSALTSMARQTPTVQRYNLYRNAVQATVCEKSRLKDSGRADLHFGSTCDAHRLTFRQWFTGYEKEMGGISHQTPLSQTINQWAYCFQRRGELRQCHLWQRLGGQLYARLASLPTRSFHRLNPKTKHNHHHNTLD